MKVVISGDSIKIGQLLKKIKLINSGGDAKWFIANNIIKINGQQPEGRGSKVAIGSTVWINDELYQIVSEKNT